MIIPGIMASVPFGATYFSVVMADNPAGFWLMDDPTGTFTEDYSGNAKHANGVRLARSGPPIVADGGYSSNLQQNLGASFVDCGPDFGSVSEFSCEGWFIFLQTLNQQMVAAKWGKLESDTNTFLAWFSPTGTINTVIQNTAGVSTTVFGSTVIATGQPHHIVFTAGGGVGRMYLNGVLDGSAAYSGTLKSGTTKTHLSYGAKIVDNQPEDMAATTSRYGQYRCDNLAFYSHTLTPGRVAAHYAAGI